MSWRHWRKLKLFAATACGVCLAKTFSPVRNVSSEKVVIYNENNDYVDQVDGVDSPNQCLPDENNLILRQVQVYFRHGARTPLQITPGIEQAGYFPEFVLRDAPHTLFWYSLTYMDNTPVESSSFDYQYRRTKLKGGGHAGMLTSYGQDQMYLLGRQLRYDYINTGFLCPEYNEEQIFVRSTNMKRTIDSARCVLAGLYTAEELNKTCSVKIVTSPSIDEVLFPNNIHCPVVKDVINATMVDFDNIPGIKEDRMKVESALGLDSTKDGHKLHFVHMRDDLTARMAHGWMVPKVVLPFMDLVEENATKLLYFAMCGKTEEERKTVLPLSVGPALTMSVKMMEDMMNGKSQKKMCLYSTHDSLMICLLEAFGLYNNTWPEYAADFRLELYEDRNQEFWVKVRYCGQDKSLPPCSESMFSFDQFSKMMKPYVKEKKEYLRICNSNILKNLSKGGSR